MPLGAVALTYNEGVKPYRARWQRLPLWLGTLVAAVMLFYAKEAWVSGSHYVRFLEPKFIYEYDDGMRKSFYTAEDAKEYFAYKQQRSNNVFTAALPLFAAFFHDAARHGIHIAELRLRLLSQEALAKAPISSAAQLLGNAGEQYPRVVVLNLNTADKSAYDTSQLTFVLDRALEQQQASWLWEQAAALQFAKLDKREAAISAVGNDATKRFQPGLAAVKMGKNFALAVGCTEELRPENVALFQAQADALAKEIWPTIQSAFQNEELLGAFFTSDHRQLISVEEKLGKRPDDVALARLFNPYGPLLDSLGMRTTVQVGGLRVALLFVGKDKEKVPQPTYALTRWLQRALEGPASEGDSIGVLLKSAQDAHDPAAQKAALDELVKLAKEPVLRTVGGQRIIDFFVKHALSDPASKDPLRPLTIENLRWISCPEKRRVYFELLKTRRMEGVMSVISQAFGEMPDDETAAALIAMTSDTKASEDSRKWARYGLQSQLAVLKRTAEPKNAALQERVEKALAAEPH